MSSTQQVEIKPEEYDQWSEEQKAFYKKYQRLPSQNELLTKKDKKQFDSADWTLAHLSPPKSA